MTDTYVGSIEVPKPKTRSQAKKLYSNDKIKSLTKLKLQQYIESFFNKLGSNFDLLSAVSPRFINYNIDKSFDPQTDPTQRKMQIARYFNELKNIIPSILVVDGGVIPVSQSIGLISNSSTHGQIWQGYYPIFRKIPITIIAAARDMDEADEMSGIISLMFNELRNLAGGNYISGNRSEAENWVIALPNAPVECSALSNIDVQGDPLEKIFYTEASFEVYYEDVVVIASNMAEVEYGGVVIGDSNLKKSILPIIHIPDQVSINTQPTVFVENIQDSYLIQLSNGTVATLSSDLKLTPRRFGKVSIQVMDTTKIKMVDRILAEKEIEII